MSVTRPTLIFLPAAAVDVVPPVVLAAAPVPVELLSLLPQAATANAPTARVRAIRIARNALRCTAPPYTSPRGAGTPSADGLRQSTEPRGPSLLVPLEAWT